MNAAEIPADDLTRQLKVVHADQAHAPHLSLVGDTYTVLLSGQDTRGAYCLIDMHIPPGGGPPPHRHDFEESFTILAGEVEFTFRDASRIVRVGETAHIPANAPHRFQSIGKDACRLLCICSPAGQDRFFAEVGVPVSERTSAPPQLDAQTKEAAKAKATELAPQFRTELIKPAPRNPA